VNIRTLRARSVSSLTQARAVLTYVIHVYQDIAEEREEKPGFTNDNL
jgi:hypothetical protein